MTETATIGRQRIAEQIAAYHHGAAEWLPNDCDQIGAGAHRTVYVDYNAEIVYKLGDDDTNRHEVQVLTAARQAGRDYAPPVALYEVAMADMFGDRITCTIVAMPYLPEDGSVNHDGVIFPEAADFNADNVVANGGQLWLIDAGGM